MADRSRREVLSALRDAIDSWSGELSEAKEWLSDAPPSDRISELPVFEISEPEVRPHVGGASTAIEREAGVADAPSGDSGGGPARIDSSAAAPVADPMQDVEDGPSDVSGAGVLPLDPERRVDEALARRAERGDSDTAAVTPERDADAVPIAPLDDVDALPSARRDAPPAFTFLSPSDVRSRGAAQDDAVARAKEKIAELQSLVGVMREEVGGLRESVRTSRDAQTTIEGERRHTFAELELLRERYEALESKTLQRDTESRRAGRELAFAREQLHALNAAAQEAKDTAAKYAEQYEETSRALGRSRLTQERMAEQIEERTAAVHALRSENERLQRVARELPPELLARVEEALQDTTSGGASVRAALSALADRAEEAGGALEDAAEAREQWAELVLELSTALEAASIARDAAQLEHRSAAEAIERERLAFAAREEALRREIGEVRDESSEMRDDAERFAVINQQLTEELQRLQDGSDTPGALQAEIDDIQGALSDALGDDLSDAPVSEAFERYRLERESVERALRAELSGKRRSVSPAAATAKAEGGMAAVAPDLAAPAGNDLTQSTVDAARELLARAGQHISGIVQDESIRPAEEPAPDAPQFEEDTDVVIPEGARDSLEESQRLIAGLEAQLKHRERAEKAYRAESETLKQALDRTSSLLSDTRGELEAMRDGSASVEPVPLGAEASRKLGFDFYQPNSSLQEEIERTMIGRARRQTMAWGLMLVVAGVLTGFVTLFALAGTGNNPVAILLGAGGRIPFLGIHQMLLLLSVTLVVSGALLTGTSTRRR